MPSAASNNTTNNRTKKGKDTGSTETTSNTKNSANVKNPLDMNSTTDNKSSRQKSVSPLTIGMESMISATTSSFSSGASGKDQPIMEQPLKQGITYVEHKIRNLEKRKQKLDSYKQEQSQGKELNADQLNAVSKYNEVIQQLDFSREIEKQLSQIHIDCSKLLKKQQKKEQADRALADFDRLKEVLTLQAVLQQMAFPKVRKDFMEGTNGAIKLTREQFLVLDELAPITASDAALLEQLTLTSTTEHLTNLLEEKPKPMVGSSLTYKDAKVLILELASSDYFDPTRSRDSDMRAREMTEKVTASTSLPIQSFLEQPSTNILTDTKFNFLPESQMEIESPHMDPAVVAVSSYAPPLMPHQCEESNSNMFTNMKDRSGLIASHIGGGDMNATNLTVKDDETYDEWVDPNAKPQPQEWSNMLESGSALKSDGDLDSNDRENDEYDYNNRRDGRSGGYRGNARSSRGSMNNGYRGGQARGGYQNGKGGGSFGTFDHRRNDRFGDNQFGEFRAPRPRGSGNNGGAFGNRSEGNTYGGRFSQGPRAPGRGNSQYRGGGSSSVRGGNGSY